MKKYTAKGPILLFLCAIFWGFTFSAQSSAMAYIGPYTFVFGRSVITAVILSIFQPLLSKLSGEDKTTASAKRHWIVGAVCGALLIFASLLQQVGIVTTTAAKSGFITALYILMVPILGVFIGNRLSRNILIAVPVSLIGLYLLCGATDFTLGIGDILTFGCAIVYAVHILVIDRLGSDLDPIRLSTCQFVAAAVFSGIVAFIAEDPSWTGIMACWPSVAFAGFFSGVLGYTLQIVGQKYTEPTVASLIMCLESVFAAVGGWLVLHERLSLVEMLGCMLMLGATAIALMPNKTKQ